MVNLRHIHRYMADRRGVVLEDGRTGKIVRVDTVFPEGETTVSVWAEGDRGPRVAKIRLDRIVGPVDESDKASA